MNKSCEKVASSDHDELWQKIQNKNKNKRSQNVCTVSFFGFGIQIAQPFGAYLTLSALTFFSLFFLLKQQPVTELETF